LSSKDSQMAGTERIKKWEEEEAGEVEAFLKPIGY
jgi:hypothetical protein